MPPAAHALSPKLAHGSSDTRAARTEFLLQALLTPDDLQARRCSTPSLESARWREQPGYHRQNSSRCSSSSSTLRSSRGKESLQAASSAMLASPPIGRRGAPTFHRSADWAFPQNARGYRTRRGGAGEMSDLAQRHLDDEGSCSPTPSPLSANSTSASLAGELSSSEGSATASPVLPAVRVQPPTEACAPARPAAAAKDEGLGEFGDVDMKTDKLLSRLLQRRRSGPLTLRTGGLLGTRMGRRGSAPVVQSFPAPPKKHIRRLRQDEKIFDLYHWDEVLQEEGDGGKVVVCQPKGTSGPSAPSYVLKMKSKDSLAEQNFEEQFRRSQLRMLNFQPHAGVLPIHEVLEDERFYYIVMEKASGGNFFSSLLSEFQDGVMPAKAVQKVIREILEAVSHVHKQGMLHRDIKPDNLVMQVCDDGTPGKVKQVALIDFDHADPDWDPATPLRHHEVCGTVEYSAPETFLGFFTQASDLYSVGVILYLLMAGRLPYDDHVYAGEVKRRDSMLNQRCVWGEAIVQHMKGANIDWQCDPWPQQPLCRNFCRALLAFDPLSRPATAEEAMEHPWFDQD